MEIGERFAQSFTKNPLAWALGGLLVFSVYSHYNTGKEFTKVCDTIVMLEEGYLDPDTLHKYQTTGIELDSILESVMIEAKEHDRLMSANTPDARAYRWWLKNVNYIIKICGNRLAEPDPRDDY